MKNAAINQSITTVLKSQYHCIDEKYKKNEAYADVLLTTFFPISNTQLTERVETYINKKKQETIKLLQMYNNTSYYKKVMSVENYREFKDNIPDIKKSILLCSIVSLLSSYDIVYSHYKIGNSFINVDKINDYKKRLIEKKYHNQFMENADYFLNLEKTKKILKKENFDEILTIPIVECLGNLKMLEWLYTLDPNQERYTLEISKPTTEKGNEVSEPTTEKGSEAKPKETTPIQVKPKKTTPIQVKPKKTTPIQVKPKKTIPIQVKPKALDAIPTQKLIWNGCKATLEDVLIQLKTMTNDKNQPMLDASYSRLATFLFNNFENYKDETNIKTLSSNLRKSDRKPKKGENKLTIIKGFVE